MPEGLSIIENNENEFLTETPLNKISGHGSKVLICN